MKFAGICSLIATIREQQKSESLIECFTAAMPVGIGTIGGGIWLLLRWLRRRYIYHVGH